MTFAFLWRVAKFLRVRRTKNYKVKNIKKYNYPVTQIGKQEGNSMSKCCEVVYFKHDMGWDCYEKSECHKFQGAWLPRWFDNPVVEDAPTKKEAMRQIKDLHILGVCLVKP